MDLSSISADASASGPLADETSGRPALFAEVLGPDRAILAVRPMTWDGEAYVLTIGAELGAFSGVVIRDVAGGQVAQHFPPGRLVKPGPGAAICWRPEGG